MSVQKSCHSQRELEQVQCSALSVPWNYSPAHLPISTAPHVNRDAAEQLEGSKCGTRRPGLLFQGPGLAWITVSVPAGTASIMSIPTPLRRHPPTLHMGEAQMDQLIEFTQEKRKKE